MNVVQGMRSTEASADTPVAEDPVKKIAKKTAVKIKQSQSTGKDMSDLVLVSEESHGARFDLIIDTEIKIRGVRAQGGKVLFNVPRELAERALRHVHVTSGRLVSTE